MFRTRASVDYKKTANHGAFEEVGFSCPAPSPLADRQPLLQRPFPVFLFLCAATNRGNLAFRTTIIEDTSNTSSYFI